MALRGDIPTRDKGREREMKTLAHCISEPRTQSEAESIRAAPSMERVVNTSSYKVKGNNVVDFMNVE